jgi:hypothetical protein
LLVYRREKGDPMSVLNKIAFFQNIRNDTPNQELARELAQSKDQDGVREIVENLQNTEQNIQSDCLKVLYELGYLDPGLIADYVDDFLALLTSKNNRMVWGSTIALSTIADLQADKILEQQALIRQTMEKGSVITVDNGVKILARAASKKPGESGEIFAYLLTLLETCRPKDVPAHAENILAAVNAGNKDGFLRVITTRMPEMSESQAKRLKKVVKEAEKSL